MREVDQLPVKYIPNPAADDWISRALLQDYLFYLRSIRLEFGDTLDETVEQVVPGLSNALVDHEIQVHGQRFGRCKRLFEAPSAGLKPRFRRLRNDVVPALIVRDGGVTSDGDNICFPKDPRRHSDQLQDRAL
jgi:hypothetical protein